MFTIAAVGMPFETGAISKVSIEAGSTRVSTRAVRPIACGVA